MFLEEHDGHKRLNREPSSPERVDHGNSQVGTTTVRNWENVLPDLHVTMLVYLQGLAIDARGLDRRITKLVTPPPQL